MAPFCMGSGITMGTNGLKWAGDDPEDDCIMLWTHVFGVTSVGRAVIASTTVFLMALLAQYFTTRSRNKIQLAKDFAKRNRAAPLSFPSQYYDPEQGRRANGANGSNGYGNGAAGHKVSKQQAGNANNAVVATVTSVSTSSRSIPAPAAVRTTIALPASTLFSNNSNGTAPPRLPSSSSAVSQSGVNVEKVSDYEHLCDSVQHGLRILLAYLLMLAAMTYDVTLLASIVLGFTLGYFLFTNDTSKVPFSADPCCS